MSLHEIVTDPAVFFKREPEGLITPWWVFGAATVTNTTTVVVAYGSLFQYVTGLGEALVGGIVGIAGVVRPISLFAEWVMFAGFFHLMALAAGSRGSFRSLFRAMGWGFLPTALQGVITTGLLLIILGEVPPGASLEQAIAAIEAQLLWATRGVTVVMRLWQAVLWMFAVYELRDVSLRQAAVIVGCPTAGVVAHSLLVATGVL